MSTLTATSLSGAITDYYEKKLLNQPEFKNDLLKYGQKGQIPKGNSDTIHWTRVDRFGRAQTVTDGTDLSTERTPTISTVQGKLALFGDFVKITPYGDELRIFSMIEKSYDEFILQAQREANMKLQETMIAGDSTTGNSFPAATLMYAGGANQFSDLKGDGSFGLNVKDVESAIHYLRKQKAPGKIKVVTNAWGMEDMLLDDKFRTLVATQNLKMIQEADIPIWAGASMGWNDDGYRCDLAAQTGVLTTYSATGSVHVTWVFADDAFGTVQLMGKGGLRPRFKTQDISIIGNLITIGYFLPFKGGVLNANWIVGIVHVNTKNAATISGFTT